MEIKAKDLVEQYKIPHSMAKRLVMLGDETLIEEAVKEYEENGSWKSGGSLWTKPEEEVLEEEPDEEEEE